MASLDEEHLKECVSRTTVSLMFGTVLGPQELLKKCSLTD